MAIAATQRAVAQSPDEVVYTPQSTTFNVTTDPKARKVCIELTDGDTGKKHRRTVKRMVRTGRGQWKLTVANDLKGKYYRFVVDGDYEKRSTPGLFAKAVGVNGQYGAIVDMAETNPEGWTDDRRPELHSAADLVIYELHHRDFSVHPSSGIANKGKFLALTEPQAISHLQRLGVNAVHILPSFDFASIDESRPDKPQYNWGYDPLNYNVPEGSYATSTADPTARIREFKQMVMALHKAGIRVILDVVYNHTFDIAGSNFQKLNPDYFFRRTADGKYSDGSGCGNETASEKPLMRQFMAESVKYWVQEYHIDGFRFDLMGVHDIATMNYIRAEIDKIDPSVYIYGEGWSAGSCTLDADSLATKANTPRLDRIGAFCDDMRDALRGPFSDDTKGGFLAGAKGCEESIKFGIAGAISHPQIDMAKVNYSKKAWATEPTQMIAYVSCHDDMCLADRLRASIPGITDDELVRLDLLAQTAVLTSQGVPFILCGEEMLRDKKGVHNSYNSPDSINRLDWDGMRRHPEVMEYYSRLIALRKGHPAFRLGNAEEVRKHLEFIEAPEGVVAFRLKGNAGGDDWNDIIVALNANREPVTINIPQGRYTTVAAQGRIDCAGMGTTTGTEATVAAQSALIMHN